MQITISLSKKQPGSQEFSSESASATLTADCSPQDVLIVAGDLQQQAEAIINQHLNPSEPPPRPPIPTHSRSHNPPPKRLHRRGPPPISNAQKRLLSRMLSDTADHGHSWLAARGHESLEGLTIPEASALIDELKGGAN